MHERGPAIPETARFELATAGRVVFGPGTVRELPEALAAWGRQWLVVTGRSGATRLQPLVETLTGAGLQCEPWVVSGEPTVEEAMQGVAAGRAAHVEGVLAIGGGSVLDGGKAIAALIANPGDPLQYLEVIGQGRPLAAMPMPFVAVPTTAGTGAEVTRNAVLASTAHRVKVSLRSPMMLPRLALVDPELTHSVPPATTAASGLDALTQLIEPLLSVRANPLTDGLCREGMTRVARSLRAAYESARRQARDPSAVPNSADRAARSDMALASLFGGFALANAGLGIVHGFAGPVGGAFPAPHGAVCAALLPHALAANLRALRSREPESGALMRMDEVARLLIGRAAARAEDGIEWVRELCRDLSIPGLSVYGVTAEDIDALVEKAGRASSTKGNPIVLRPEEMADLLHRAL